VQRDGRPYPALAQHAVREARHLARNIKAAIDGRVPSPFMFRTLGTMASLGHTRAVARVFGVRLTGFVAWWLRRTYYLFQMPRAGTGGCALSSIGPSRCSSALTSHGLTCASNESR
jgi:NADH:ubiquinone reductase (H+-translocating)